MATARYTIRMVDIKRQTKNDMEYTPLRRFYAWVGFLTLIALAIGAVAALVWAHGFINAGLM